MKRTNIPGRGKVYANTEIPDQLPGETRAQMIHMALSTKTQTLYKARIHVFEDFISEMKKLHRPGYECASLRGNEEIFAHFLAHLGHKLQAHSRSTAEGYRCAILHNQRIEKHAQWAGTRTCQSIVEGFFFQGKSNYTAPATRAQISISMHAQMIAYCKLHLPELTLAVEIGFRVALRPHELMSLKKGSYCNRKRTVTIPDKRATSRNGLPSTTQKEVFDRKANTILSFLEEEVTEEAPSYFPFNIVEFRKLFKQMCTALNFDLPKDIVLEGPHCLRHGGIAYLSARGITHSQLQVTPETMSHYVRPNHKRTRYEI